MKLGKARERTFSLHLQGVETKLKSQDFEKCCLGLVWTFLGLFYATSNFPCSRDEGEKWLLPKSTFLRVRFFRLLSR